MMTPREQYDALRAERAAACKAQCDSLVRFMRTDSKEAGDRSDEASAKYDAIQAQMNALEAAHPELKPKDYAANTERVSPVPCE